MQLNSPPDSIDLQEFQFKLQKCVQIFDPSLTLPATKFNLIAVSSKFGIIFVGAPDKTLHVLQLNDVITSEGKECARRILPLSHLPIHLAINCSEEFLSIVLIKNDALVINIYNIKCFAFENPFVEREIRLSASSGVYLCSLEWNPCQTDCLASCTSDGALSVFQCKSNSLEVQAKNTNARCLSWSPKGKQIITGNIDGTLTQYKPDLSIVKNIPAPMLFENCVLEVIAIHWISTYQFAVVYNTTSDSDNRTCVTIVNTPKVGPISCINYDDICYSMTSSNKNHFYLTHITSWGIILASSSNSMEVGVLGTNDQLNWKQWIQIDDARAELPLTDDKQENYPVGVYFNRAATFQLPWGDNILLPFMPMMHILSQNGLLVSYFTINLMENAPMLCEIPEPIVIPTAYLTKSITPLNNVTNVSTPPAGLDPSFTVYNNAITSTPLIPNNIKKTDKNTFGFENVTPKINIFNASSDMKLDKPISNESVIFESVPQNQTSSKSTFSVESIDKKTENQIQISGNAIYRENIPKLETKTNNVYDKEKNIYEPEIQCIPNEIIKAMLTKEINNFQNELHDLLKKCKNITTEIGNEEEMNCITTVLSNCDKLDNLWSDQEIKRKMTILKYNLINTCAFLAEAKIQPISTELEQLAQLDPVSMEKMASIKALIYYVKSQLEQINSALDEEWQLFQEECKRKALALRGISDNDYMKMPTLDKIYQPLLKQADILAKQQLIVSELQKTIANMGLAKDSNKKNVLKVSNESTSLSGLTKDLYALNLQSVNHFRKNYNSNCNKNIKEKNIALRKLLKNHSTVTIKPIKSEMPSMLQTFQDWNCTAELDQMCTVNNDSLSTNEDQNIVNNQKVDQEREKKFFEDFHKNESTQNNIGNNPLYNLNSIVSNFNISLPVKSSEDVKGLVNTNQKSVRDIEVENAIRAKTESEKPVQTDNKSAFSQFFNTNSSFNNKGVFSQYFDSNSSFAPFSSTSVNTISASNVLAQMASNLTGVAGSTSTIFDNKQAENPDVNSGSQFIKPFQMEKSDLKSQITFSASTFLCPISENKDKNINTISKSTVNITQILPSVDLTNTSNTPVATIFSPSFVHSVSASKEVSKVFDSFTNSLEINTVKNITKNTEPIIDNDKNQSTNLLTSNELLRITVGDTLLQNNSTLPISSTTIQNSSTVTTKPEIKVISEANSSSLLNNKETTDEEKTNEVLKTSSKSNDPVNVIPNAENSTFTSPLFKLTSSASETSSIFTPSMTTNTLSVTTSSLFGNTQPFSTTNISQAVSSVPSTTSPVFSTTTTPVIFGSPNTVNTCASSLFGAANAAIDTSVISAFGSANISTTTAPSVFNTSPTLSTPANSIFSKGNIFGTQQNTFGNANKSIFGGNNTTNPIFGNNTTFSGFGGTSQTSNIFNQNTQQPSNIFGSPTNAGQGNIFGNASVPKSSFGSPNIQQSAFGSPTTTATPVFGGSPTFGAKPVFGQPASFGSSPGGTFGMFSTSDQPSVAQSGFGSPSAFGAKPAGVFGGSPEFGASSAFGSSTFGGSPTFGNNINAFGPTIGAQTAFGTQQSATFESLASSSSISFGNLAQQSQPMQQPSQPFQGSSSFSTWR